MTALSQTITVQADAIAHVADLDLDAPVAELRKAEAVLLVGTRTSQHAAELGAFQLRAGGLRTRSTAAADLARWDEIHPDEAVIITSHTGETAFAQRCRQDAIAAGRPLVTITGPDAGWPEAVRTPVAESSETYTGSYVAVSSSVPPHRPSAGAGEPTRRPSPDRSGSRDRRRVERRPAVATRSAWSGFSVDVGRRNRSSAGVTTPWSTGRSLPRRCSALEDAQCIEHPSHAPQTRMRPSQPEVEAGRGDGDDLTGCAFDALVGKPGPLPRS